MACASVLVLNLSGEISVIDLLFAEAVDIVLCALIRIVPFVYFLIISFIVRERNMGGLSTVVE